MSEEKKLSAVEWLVKELEEHHVFHDIKNTNAYQIAKAMEKQQVINAFGVGCQVESTRLIGYQDLAEQYYNENFGVQ